MAARRGGGMSFHCWSDIIGVLYDLANYCYSVFFFVC